MRGIRWDATPPSLRLKHKQRRISMAHRPHLYPRSDVLSSQDQDTPLHFSSFYGNMGVSRALLEAGADVDARNKVRGHPRMYVRVHFFCVTIWHAITCLERVSIALLKAPPAMLVRVNTKPTLPLRLPPACLATSSSSESHSARIAEE